MTNYNDWDKKARDLVAAADDDDAQQKADADKALGLEGGPKGPPTVNAEKEMAEMGDHSKQRQEFIDWSKQREVVVTHSAEDSPVTLQGEDVQGKAVRISGSIGVTYRVPQSAGLLKLMVDKCKRVRVQLEGTLLTSSAELYSCEDLDLELMEPMGVIQVDECIKPTRVRFAERDHVGKLYHQNSPGLMVSWGDDEHVVGRAVEAQFSTSLNSTGAAEQLLTIPVRRGEGEFPVDLGRPMAETHAVQQPDPELPPNVEETARLVEEARLKGNDMFRANDFLQAAMLYSQALDLDPTISTLFANRAQCFLKLGDHEKALMDATKCTELDPPNAKGWFRKGMSLHAMSRHAEAIPALLEAEKLDPKNKQIPEAIRMAQMKARMEAGR